MVAESEPGAPARAKLHDAKQRARDEVLARRAALSPPAREAASRAIVAAIVASAEFGSARFVLLTMPFRGEWDTLPLVRAALAADKVVVLPRVDTVTRMLRLHGVDDPQRDLEPGFAGIAEPRANLRAIREEAIDWVLVPGLAFDAQGRRLGYGGGYYDRLLPRLRPLAFRAAGAFDEQVVDAVPVAPHDARIHALYTPTRRWTW